MVENLPAVRETQVQFLSGEDPLDKGMATHSSVLAWRIPWTEEPGGLKSMESQRVGCDWATNTFTVRKPPDVCCCFFPVNTLETLNSFKVYTMEVTLNDSFSDRQNPIQSQRKEVCLLGLPCVVDMYQLSISFEPSKSYVHSNPDLTSGLRVWYNPGIPHLWDLIPDDLRWSWCNSNKRNKVHNRHKALESSWNHPRPCLWKNCLP